MFHRHTKAGTICRPVSGGMIPAVLLFHYFVDDCPLCTPMASTEAVAANRYDHSYYNKFGQESQAASLAFFPSRA